MWETQIEFAGEFFCWIGDLTMHSLNIRTEEVHDLSLDTMAEDPAASLGFKRKPPRALFNLNACDPLTLIEAGMVCKIDKQVMQRLANHV